MKKFFLSDLYLVEISVSFKLKLEISFLKIYFLMVFQISKNNSFIFPLFLYSKLITL